MARKPPKADKADTSSTDAVSTDSELLSAKESFHTTMEVVEDAKLLDKRRRHREKIMRYRRKKRATADEMKTQEQFLAMQLHSMLDLHASQSQTYSHGQDADPSRPDQESPTAMDAFVNVLTEKERLHEENTALRRHLDEYYKLHESLQKTLNEDAEEKEKKQRENHTRRRLGSDHCKNEQSQGARGDWLQFLPNETPFFYVPLTEFECDAYVSRTLESVFAMQSAYLSGGYRGAHVVTLFDWTASLLLDFDEATQMPMIRYEFKKTFRNSPRTIEELVESEWNILHSPGLYQNLHRVPVKSKVLQRVNEDLSVVMWNAPDPEQSLRFRNVMVFSRTAYQNPDGHDCRLISMTTVPLKSSVPEEKDSVAASGVSSQAPPSPQVTTGEGEPVVFVTLGFLYTAFSCGDQEQQSENRNEVHVAFGGHVSILSEEQGRFLMVELGGTCVRLEHLLFPRRVLR